MSEPDDLEKQLAELSYLWTSGEWQLERYWYTRMRVFIVFSGGTTTTKELVAIRGLLPHFAELPVTRLKEEIAGKPEYFVGELGSMSGPRFIERARAKGLTIRTEDASRMEYLLDTVPGTAADDKAEAQALIIENGELAEMVIARMLKEGVPVVDAAMEVDD